MPGTYDGGGESCENNELLLEEARLAVVILCGEDSAIARDLGYVCE
jgi:hypothetical protein